MGRIKLAALLLVSVCAGAAGAQVFARQKPVAPLPEVKFEPIKLPTVKWRYKMVRLVPESDLADKANEEADQGWEVVQAVLANDKTLQYSILLRRRTVDVKD